MLICIQFIYLTSRLGFNIHFSPYLVIYLCIMSRCNICQIMLKNHLVLLD